MIKEKDFIEIDFTGKVTESGFVFDTTSKDVAQENGLNPEAEYVPMKVCVGEGMLLKGLEEAIIGKNVGEKFTVDLIPENAFGKKSAKLLQMIPARVFKKQQIVPQIGLQVEIDGRMGIIKTAASGRIIVDFNNPLSGKDVSYEVKINKALTENVEKVSTIVGPVLGNPKIEDKEGKITIEVPFEVPKEISENYVKRLKEIIPEIKGVEFLKVSAEKTKQKGTEKKAKKEENDTKEVPKTGEKEPEKSATTKK